MSNTRRIPEVPAAKVPQSAEVGAHTVAQEIGQAVSLNISRILAPLLTEIARQQHQPACVFCVQAAKKAETAHAQEHAGNDNPPVFNVPRVEAAVTWMPVQTAPGVPPAVLPVCYGHFDTGPQMRPTGLVSASGTPIVARG